GEENFDEAAAAILKSLNKPSLPSGLRQIFEDPNTKEPQKDSANFWLVANAIQKFHHTYGSLPLPGALPDMKAQSQDYIQLQNIYKAKARKDADEVTKSIRSMEADVQRQTPVDAKEIESFCKGAAFVKLIKGKPLPISNPQTKIPQEALNSILDDEDSLLPIFVAFQAYDYWCHQKSNTSPEAAPATSSSEENPTLEPLKQSASQLIDQHADEIMPKIEPILKEFVRADGAELHNISALTGGMVAQEVIKVLTKQYIPIDNTCVFDGIASKSAVFRV
ncbi:MAG: hypothetical protein Q9198_008893, partial [Flavoplaca austrocitrina]